MGLGNFFCQQLALVFIFCITKFGSKISAKWSSTFRKGRPLYPKWSSTFSQRSSTLPQGRPLYPKWSSTFSKRSSTLQHGRPLYHKVVHFKVVHFAFLGSSTFTPNPLPDVVLFLIIFSQKNFGKNHTFLGKIDFLRKGDDL